MFGSVALDVAIGLILLYFLLAVLVSTLNEFLAAFADTRAKNLEIGLRNLLQGNDHAGQPLIAAFYNHALIQSMHTRRFFFAPAAGAGKKPSYIPAAIFRSALEDLVLPASAAGPRSLQALRESVDKLPPGLTKDVLQELLTEAGVGVADLAKARAAIEDWFDDAMDRVSGWYKRQVQLIILVIAVIIAAALNADTFEIANTLVHNPETRAFAVATAEQLAKSAPAPTKPPAPGTAAAPSANKLQEALTGLTEAQLPLGWRNGWDDVRAAFGDLATFLRKFFGLAITGVAVSLGAPFWFDLLGKLVSLRTAVKPKKADEEAKS